MKCIVCDGHVRIETLKQLFSLQPLLLCGCCSEHLIPKSMDVLYEDNDWIRTVIERLNQGDLVLAQLFRKSLQSALFKKRAIHSKIEIVESKQELSYPWLEILMEGIYLDSKCSHLKSPLESFVVAVEKQKEITHQISIIG